MAPSTDHAGVRSRRRTTIDRVIAMSLSVAASAGTTHSRVTPHHPRDSPSSLDSALPPVGPNPLILTLSPIRSKATFHPIIPLILGQLWILEGVTFRVRDLLTVSVVTFAPPTYLLSTNGSSSLCCLQPVDHLFPVRSPSPTSVLASGVLSVNRRAYQLWLLSEASVLGRQRPGSRARLTWAYGASCRT